MERVKPLTKNIRPGEPPLDLASYEKNGGYESLKKALIHMTPREVQEEVGKSDLRGRGGAGFPTGKKWSFVPMGDDAPKHKYFCVNGDEMEPGSFKDRYLLEGDPHLMVEGLIVSSYAIQADGSYIFLRWAYHEAARRLEKAIAEAYQVGYLGENILGTGYTLHMHVHSSAGRYMAGEETGLINSIEGKRANPRAKPPYPQTCGLWGRPTVVNNVETVCSVPQIVNNGAEWYKNLSHTEDGGTKLYGVAGRTRKTGIWELPMGTTLREIIEEHAGGMKEGYTLRGLIPGGASTEFVAAKDIDVRMDFNEVQRVGSRMGTGTIIVLDDKTCPVGMTLNMMRFFHQESCGWCTPCWGGLQVVKQILEDIEAGNGKEEDLDTLDKYTKLLWLGHTFCALAPGAMETLIGALRHYRDDFRRHIREKKCPWK
jgi:NADH-quinone oxidoreductase subunit F